MSIRDAFPVFRAERSAIEYSRDIQPWKPPRFWRLRRYAIQVRRALWSLLPFRVRWVGYRRKPDWEGGDSDE